MNYSSLLPTLLLSIMMSLNGCSSSDNDDANAGATDSGSSDSGTTDAGTTDAGATDAGTTDAGTTDAGTTDAGTTDAGTTDPVVSSCEIIDTSILPTTGGVFSGTLPADLSVPGSRIELGLSEAGEFIAFDSSSGAVDFVPSASRLAAVVDYQVKDAGGAILSTHQHRYIFSPVRVMPLGDSITSGVEFFDGVMDTPPMPERVGYRKALYDRLTNQGYAIDYMGQGGQAAGADAGLIDPENNGYPGVDIDFLNGKLVEQLTEDKADIILLHIGTNNTPANAQGIDDWLDALDAWEATNQPVLALVATIVPKRDVGLNAIVDQFNLDLINRVAARTQDRVLLVDQNAAVSVADLSDEQIGLHPSSEGYEKMAATWYDSLTDATQGPLFTCE